MAWMIKAGIDRTGPAARAALSVASNNQAGACGWRFVSTNCDDPGRHPQLAAHAGKQVWQDVLAQLTIEL